IAARIYAPALRKPGMTAFRGDVRRLALLGVPNEGLDVAFAYPNLNYWIIVNDANAALVGTDALLYGIWTDLRPRSIYHDGAGRRAGSSSCARRSRRTGSRAPARRSCGGASSTSLTSSSSTPSRRWNGSRKPSGREGESSEIQLDGARRDLVRGRVQRRGDVE